MAEYAFPSLGGGPSYNTGFSGASPHTAGYGAGYYTTPISTQSNGMTLRDYFAAQALAGILANHSVHYPEWNARVAYETADALMKRRAGE